MIPFAARALVTALVSVSAVVMAPAAEPAIIAKARAYLGTEEALNAVNSVHYTGTLTTVDPADPAKETRAAMDIVFQKPELQRIKATSDRTIEVTALDGYEGWQRIQDVKDPTKWRQTLLGVEQIKRLRANTWENLAFFRGIERLGGRVEDQGTTTVDGTTCQKVAFIHSPTIIFNRYFDVATGRLVFTETEAGGTIKEQGEIIVAGVRFPRSIITSTRNAAGQKQTVTINFDQIRVNEVFPASMFRIPLPGKG